MQTGTMMVSVWATRQGRLNHKHNSVQAPPHTSCCIPKTDCPSSCIPTHTSHLQVPEPLANPGAPSTNLALSICPSQALVSRQGQQGPCLVKITNVTTARPARPFCLVKITKVTSSHTVTSTVILHICTKALQQQLLKQTRPSRPRLPLQCSAQVQLPITAAHD